MTLQVHEALCNSSGASLVPPFLESSPRLAEQVLLQSSTELPIVGHSTARSVLQRDLADARGALQKQWRELSASFEDQLRHLELECNNRVEQASQQMELALQQASERESEAAAAHSKERTATDAAAVSRFLFISCIKHAR